MWTVFARSLLIKQLKRTKDDFHLRQQNEEILETLKKMCSASRGMKFEFDEKILLEKQVEAG